MPTLALTHALQGKGRLAEARAAAHALNAAHPGFAIGLAREAELALTQNDVRAGQVQVGVRNLGDTQFQYTDPDPLNPRFSVRRLVYGTVRLTW